MSIFEPIIKDNLQGTQIEKLQQKQHELVWVRREKIQPGHTLFSYNVNTGEIKVAPVQYSKDVDFVTRDAIHKPKIVIEPNCVYRQALNKRNFIKRLKREGIIY